MKPISIFLFFTIAFIACTKESEPTLIESLSKSNWQKTEILNSIDSITSNPDDTLPVNIIVPDDCKKDNVWSFNSTTNTFLLDEGATKCNASDPQTKDQGTITALNNGSQLRVAGTGTNEIWEIESRSASSFRVSYFAKNNSNKTVKFRVTFNRL